MQNLLVYGGGLLALIPAVSQLGWVFATAFSDPEKGSALGATLITVTAVLSLLAVIAFAIHAWAGENEYTSTEKTLWTLAMLFCFAPAVVPVYWYVTIFRPWLNRSDFEKFNRLGGSY